MTRRDLLLRVSGAIILTAQGIASHLFRRDPILPVTRPLSSSLPLHFENWVQSVDETIGSEVLEALGPDDILSRRYQLPGSSRRADVFVAYYRSQLRAKKAHDPKVCLPGAGWNPLDSRVLQLEIPSAANAIPVNYYLLEKEARQEVVLYWFQTHRGVYNSEQILNLHRLLDAVRDNRTDMALVRIIVPVNENGGEGATADGLKLAQLVYLEMVSYLPNGNSGHRNV